MNRPKWIGIVFGMIAIGFLMMPMLALAQLGTGVTIMFDSDSVGAKSNGFMSGDDPDAAFFDTVGQDLAIVEFPPEAAITNKMLQVGGSDGSFLEVIFTHPLADFSLQYSCDTENEPCDSSGATATLKVFEDAADSAGSEICTVTVQIIRDSGGDHENMGANGGDCPLSFPNGFEKIQFIFSNNLTEHVDELHGNPFSGGSPSGCDSMQGAAYGLCTAYCEAMDCDGVPQASETACDRVMTNYRRATGDANAEPPCLQ